MQTSAKLTIHEAVKQAIHAEDVELIDVQVLGSSIALLRVKSMAEYAFVMWVVQKTSTYSQMMFRMPHNGHSDDRYPVVCACCPSETYGFEKPDHIPSDEWDKQMACQFRATLVGTALAHGITTLFMRRAEAWNAHYGYVHGLNIVEANGYQKAMLELYGRKPIEQAFQFIDRHSHGLSA